MDAYLVRIHLIYTHSFNIGKKEASKPLRTCTLRQLLGGKRAPIVEVGATLESQCPAAKRDLRNLFTAFLAETHGRRRGTTTSALYRLS